jgi:CubicO group peptidase (beta-lactamase class C family)
MSLLEGFDGFVEVTRQEWQVPGIAVAAIHDGDVVLSRGFGSRDVERDLPVTPLTFFPLASVTKSFTATAMALLVDDGIVEWDTPVKEYLSDFELWDTSRTYGVTPRDLLAHNTGLPRHDAAWFNRAIERGELMQLLRHLEPNTDLRTTYQYSNLMFMAAGHLIGAVTGATYEEFVRSRLLEPLGMTETNFSIARSKETEDCSRGHAKRDDIVQAIPYYERQQAIGPAGMIVSNVAELIRWVRFHLADGRTEDGTQLVSREQIHELRRIQTPYRIESLHPEEQGLSGYGLGWGVNSLHGRSLVNHGGGINGFSTFAAFIPELGSGITILTNLGQASGALRSITYNYFERCLGLEPLDWTARRRSEEQRDEAAGKLLGDFALAQPRSGTSPSHPLAAYAGTYAHPGYGPIEVAESGGRLGGTYNEMALELTHHHHDVFRLVIEELGDDCLVRFGTGYRGDVDSLEGPFEPFAPPIVFSRVWEHGRDRRLLEQLVGDYALDDGRTVGIRLRENGTLTGSLPMLEHRDVELVAVGRREFALRGTDLISFAVFYDEPQDGRPVERIHCRTQDALRTATRVAGAD